MALEELSQLRNALPEPKFDLFQDAREVVVIAMSGRSGSSWLVDLLKGSNDLLHFRGEMPAFLRLHGLFDVDRFGSEAIRGEQVALATENFKFDLSRDLGRPLTSFDDTEKFATECCFRIMLQWPQLSLGKEKLNEMKNAIVGMIARGQAADPDMFTREIVALVNQTHKIDENYYDFGREPTGDVTPAYWKTLWENPPFLCFKPWQMPNPEELKSKALVLKSCGDVHRLPFYKSLFPNARLRIIHLVRNPAATVNGLIDGWLSYKYLCWKTPELDIAGYTDIGESWRKHWWKFDAGPGWQEYAKSPLVEVCEFQWRLANATALAWRDTCAPDDYIRLHYEDMIRSPESRRKQISRLCIWLGIPDFDAGEGRIMNASVAPSKQRWKARERDILPVIQQSHCADLSAELSYAADHANWL